MHEADNNMRNAMECSPKFNITILNALYFSLSVIAAISASIRKYCKLFNVCHPRCVCKPNIGGM